MSCRRKTLHEGALVLALPLGRRADSHSRAAYGRRVRPSDARHHGSSAEEAWPVGRLVRSGRTAGPNTICRWRITRQLLGGQATADDIARLRFEASRCCSKFVWDWQILVGVCSTRLLSGPASSQHSPLDSHWVVATSIKHLQAARGRATPCLNEGCPLSGPLLSLMAKLYPGPSAQSWAGAPVQSIGIDSWCWHWSDAQAWPVCCGLASDFIGAGGLVRLRTHYLVWIEGTGMGTLRVSGYVSNIAPSGWQHTAKAEGAWSWSWGRRRWLLRSVSVYGR